MVVDVGRSARSVPPRCAVSGATAAVHTAPSTTASADGLLPVASRVMRGPSESTRVTVPSSPPATHTAPSPTATAVGSAPTPTTRETEFVIGSMRASVPSVRSTTQTAPSPTASALGA
jgi:hypothetical protein